MTIDYREFVRAASMAALHCKDKIAWDKWVGTQSLELQEFLNANTTTGGDQKDGLPLPGTTDSD